MKASASASKGSSWTSRARQAQQGVGHDEFALRLVRCLYEHGGLVPIFGHELARGLGQFGRGRGLLGLGLGLGLGGETSLLLRPLDTSTLFSSLIGGGSGSLSFGARSLRGGLGLSLRLSGSLEAIAWSLGGSSSSLRQPRRQRLVGSYRLGSGGLSVSSGGSGSRLRGGVGLGAGLRSRLLGRRLLGFGGGIGSGLLAEVGLEVDDAVELGFFALRASISTPS